MNPPSMRQAVGIGVIVACAATAFGTGAVTSIHKCVLEGKVTYQSDPCPSGPARKMPSVDQLNAERQKRLQQAAPTPLPATSPDSGRLSRPDPNPPLSPSKKHRDDTVAVPSAPPVFKGGFTCDGRLHCSQMRSCEEAKFFLARCPGTKMDGDNDGIPCESQWCN